MHHPSYCTSTQSFSRQTHFSTQATSACFMPHYTLRASTPRIALLLRASPEKHSFWHRPHHGHISSSVSSFSFVTGFTGHVMFVLRLISCHLISSSVALCAWLVQAIVYLRRLFCRWLSGQPLQKPLRQPSRNPSTQYTPSSSKLLALSLPLLASSLLKPPD